MFTTLFSIIGILVTIFFVVGTHEFGHFITARLLNVKILRFSIGFGKTLFRWRGKKGTEYVFALIPLGGYVQMLDENEGSVPANERHRAYNRQPFYKKFLIVLAGPAVNLLCAFILYWLIFTIGFMTMKPVIGHIEPNSIAAEAGLKDQREIISIDKTETNNWMSVIFRLLAHAGNQDTVQIETANLRETQKQKHTLSLTHWHMNALTPDPLTSLGMTAYEPNIPLVIGLIQPDSAAAAAGLKLGDEIRAINGIKVKNWQDLIQIVEANPSNTVSMQIKRHGKLRTLPVTIAYQRTLLLKKSGHLGIAPNFKIPKELLREVKYSPLSALPRAFREVGDFIYFNFLVFGKLFTGKLSVQSLGGPITIFGSAGAAFQYGIVPFLGFLAFLSIAIGVINLLPIPGLDGGHLLIETIQAIIRRPIPERVLGLIYRIGIIIIAVVMFQAVMNDVMRLL